MWKDHNYKHTNPTIFSQTTDFQAEQRNTHVRLLFPTQQRRTQTHNGVQYITKKIRRVPLARSED